METNLKPTSALLNRWRFKGWMACGALLASFATGSLLRNSRTTVAVSSAPPKGLASFFSPWRRAAAPCALLTARLMQSQQVRADSNRVFELMIYHTLPGKVAALESIFRDVSKLQAQHGLNVVGYWVPNDDPAWANTFIYIVAHPSREEAKKNWDALHADPTFAEYRRKAAALLERVDEQYKVDEVFMRPTDFSAVK